MNILSWLMSSNYYSIRMYQYPNTTFCYQTPQYGPPTYVPCVFCHSTIPSASMAAHLAQCPNARAAAPPTSVNTPFGSTQSVQYRRVVRVERKTINERDIQPIPLQPNPSMPIQQTHHIGLPWNNGVPEWALEDIGSQPVQSTTSVQKPLPVPQKPLPVPQKPLPAIPQRASYQQQNYQSTSVQGDVRSGSNGQQRAIPVTNQQQGAPIQMQRTQTQRIQTMQQVQKPTQSVPMQRPVQSIQQPVQPMQQRTQPIQQSVQPMQRPVQSTQQPVQQIQQRTQPIQQPVQQPVQQPIQRSAQPVQPVQPVQPMQRPIHPVQPTQRSVQQPVQQPVQRPAQPVQPTQQPHTIQKQVQPTRQPCQQPLSTTQTQTQTKQQNTQPVGEVETINPGSLSDRIKMFESKIPQKSPTPKPQPRQQMQAKQPIQPPRQMDPIPQTPMQSQTSLFDSQNKTTPTPSNTYQPASDASDPQPSLMERKAFLEKAFKNQSAPMPASTSASTPAAPVVTTTQNIDHFEKKTEGNAHPNKLKIPATAPGQLSLAEMLQKRQANGPPSQPTQSDTITRYEKADYHVAPKPLTAPAPAPGQKSLQEIMAQRTETRITDGDSHEVYQQQTQTLSQTILTSAPLPEETTVPSSPTITFEDQNLQAMQEPAASQPLYTASGVFIVELSKDDMKLVFSGDSALPFNGYTNAVMCIYPDQICLYYYDESSSSYQFIVGVGE